MSTSMIELLVSISAVIIGVPLFWFDIRTIKTHSLHDSATVIASFTLVIAAFAVVLGSVGTVLSLIYVFHLEATWVLPAFAVLLMCLITVLRLEAN